MILIKIFEVYSISSQCNCCNEDWSEEAPDKELSTSICFYPLGLENKDISVDNNTNGYESIADVDEVVEEVE